MKFNLKQKWLVKLQISDFLSIKSRYLFMLFSIAALCILVIGYTGWFKAKNALTDSIYNHLTSIRATRTQQIENYFKDQEAHLRALSENLMFIEALEEFSAAFKLLNLYKQVPNKKQLSELESFYVENFYPKLKANITHPKALQDFYPKASTAKYLQYHYIVENKADIGEKHLLNQAPDQSYYSEVHLRFHPAIRFLVEQKGLYDLFLIDKELGHIVYSVFKEVDFSTSLLRGPYAQSSLAKAIRAIMKNPDRGQVIIQDFKLYEVSYGAPAAFMAVPVYNKKQNYVGILAIQLPTDQINSIMTRDKNWRQDGLDASGEVYLVGNDFTMRSDSRFLIENAEDYLETLKKAKVAEESLLRIKNLNTSILNQLIKTTSVYLALEGKTGNKIVQDYRGVEVLSAYAPLKIANLRWIILAEKDLAEVNKPIRELQHAMITATVILVLITGVLSLIFASRFLQPIDEITHIITQFIAGHKVSTIKIDSGDEIGTLRNAVKQLIENSQKQREKIDEQAQENQTLMLNFLPSAIVKKLQSGEKNIAYKHPHVAIMFTSLHSFEFIEKMEASAAVNKLSKLFQSFDDLALRYDIEKIAVVGDSYIAACGLNKPRLNYAARCAEFAQQLFEVVALFNQEEELELTLRIGIGAGEVISGLIGNERYVYSLWGDAVNIASRIRYDANPNSLRVTQLVYNQLKITDGFEKCELLSLIGIGKIGTWEYKYQPFNHSS